jgi:hypothetical protein
MTPAGTTARNRRARRGLGPAPWPTKGGTDQDGRTAQKEAGSRSRQERPKAARGCGLACVLAWSAQVRDEA